MVAVSRALAGRAETVARAGSVPLVLEGDCSLTLGVLAGLQCVHHDLGLVYLDGGLDLGTPETYAPGAFDSMVLAHAVGERGTAPELARLGRQVPLTPGHLVLPFGYNPGAPLAAERKIPPGTAWNTAGRLGRWRGPPSSPRNKRSPGSAAEQAASCCTSTSMSSTPSTSRRQTCLT